LKAKPMLSVEEARSRLLAHAAVAGGVEKVPTRAALGRVLAAAVRSTIDVPPLDNSQMDGYAVRSVDLASAPVTLRVSQRIAAGHLGAALERGTVARIFTGAALPPGADAIVIQEDTTADGDQVTFRDTPRAGAWVRRAGFDVAAGADVLAAGSRLRAQDLGIAAAVGCATLTVRARMRVALLSTGDELAMPGAPLAPGQIYNSNRFMLTALLEAAGCVVQDLGIVPDRLEATRTALREAAASSELIITSGGVSVGDEDHVKAAIAAEGTIDLWQVAIKPGKPLAFGRVGATPVVGLPGNPVSSFVTFLLLARPFIRACQGVAATMPGALELRADFDWPQPDRRREFLRARLGAGGGVELFPNQNSALLSSLTWADGLIDNPASRAIGRGDAVSFLPFTALVE
jgi:molybdopterin molybdotransferase